MADLWTLSFQYPHLLCFVTSSYQDAGELRMEGRDYSVASFRDFMRQCVVMGIINPATLRSRKLAAEKLLGELKSHERNDLRMVDVEELCSRIHKLQDSTIRPCRSRR